MNESIVYVIPGTPVAWKRAGHANGTFYDKQKNDKLSCGLYISNQHKGEIYQGPLLLDITFYFAMPMTLKKKHDQMRLKPHFFKPDTSNLIKYIEDVCTSLLYKDDCLISDIIAKKRYDDIPRTEFKLIEIKS